MTDRALLYATPGHSQWEVFFSGRDSAADNCAQWAVWDNPIDDDGADVLAAGGGFRLNTPPGMMTVDRSFPDPQGRTHPVGSVISRRDEYLTDPSLGFTMQARFMLKPPTGENGFKILHRRADGMTFGAHLSPDKIVGGGYSDRPQYTTAPVPFDTMKHNIYRMVIPGPGPVWSFWANGKRLFDARGGDHRITSVIEDERTPMVILGGEKGNRTTHYEFDYVGYRRGGYLPNQVMPPPMGRVPPPLPPCGERWTSFRDATVIQYPAHAPPFAPSSVRPHVSAEVGYRTYAISLAPCANKGAYTVEWDIQCDPSIGWRGFGSYIRDWKGTIGILWSTDRVELTLGVKNTGYYEDIPIGARAVYLNTTSQPHTYRIVRPDNSMYAHLYIDGQLALPDQHLDASTGKLFDATPPPSLVFGDTLNPWAKGSVDIRDLRWSPTAFAP